MPRCLQFRPDKSLDEAIAHDAWVFADLRASFVDHSPAARPGLDLHGSILIEATVGKAPAKYGWTDVARGRIGIPL